MTVYQQIASNKRRSVVLVFIFVLFVLALGFFIGEYYGGPGYGVSGIVFAGLFSLVMTSVSYFQGDSIALLSAGAQEISKEDSPYVWNLVENLCIASGQPMPRVYIIEDPVMNAFATGRNPKHASIALTTGIIQNLENEELEGVIAHELSHINNYDTRLMMMVVVLVGMVTLIADMVFRMHLFGGRSRGSNDNRDGRIQLIFMVIGLVLIILSPIIAQLIKLAISRKREYLADASGVLLTRYADGLAGALTKIAHQEQGKMQRASNATAHLYLENPFGASRAQGRSWLANAFSTHPPIEERIARLRKMGGTGS